MTMFNSHPFRENIMKFTSIVLLAASISAGAVMAMPAAQQAGRDQHNHDHSADKAPSAATTVDGVIKKVDLEAGKLTISHGPLPNGMPAMTMLFKLKNPAMFKGLEAGQKIRFVPDNKLTITQIEVVQ